MKTTRSLPIALVVSGAAFFIACGGGGGGGGPSCSSGPPDNFAYQWNCSGNNCPDVGELVVETQTGSAVTGFVIICIGNGSCTSFCIASDNSENSFTGTVSGNCIDLTSNDLTWTAQGIATGNNMQFTIRSNASNCFGVQTRTITLGH